MHFDFPSGGGGRAWLYISTLFSGGQVRDLRMARQVTSRGFLHEVTDSTRRTKQKGAFCSKKEKDITLLLNVSFSFPGWEVYLMQVQENSISQIAADLGFLTTVEELWIFLNRQITLSKLHLSRVSCFMLFREWGTVYIYMCMCERERAWICVCVGGFI